MPNQTTGNATPAARETPSAKPAAVAGSPSTRRLKGPKPGSEEAKRGGRAVREKYGLTHYQRMGQIGSAQLKDRRGPDYFRELGRRGGKATHERYGADHFGRIGAVGAYHRHAKPLATPEAI
jgi:hypothetical protein